MYRYVLFICIAITFLIARTTGSPIRRQEEIMISTAPEEESTIVRINVTPRSDEAELASIVESTINVRTVAVPRIGEADKAGIVGSPIKRLVNDTITTVPGNKSTIIGPNAEPTNGEAENVGKQKVKKLRESPYYTDYPVPSYPEFWSSSSNPWDLGGVSQYQYDQYGSPMGGFDQYGSVQNERPLFVSLNCLPKCHRDIGGISEGGVSDYGYDYYSGGFSDNPWGGVSEYDYYGSNSPRNQYDQYGYTSPRNQYDQYGSSYYPSGGDYGSSYYPSGGDYGSPGGHDYHGASGVGYEDSCEVSEDSWNSGLLLTCQVGYAGGHQATADTMYILVEELRYPSTSGEGYEQPMMSYKHTPPQNSPSFIVSKEDRCPGVPFARFSVFQIPSAVFETMGFSPKLTYYCKAILDGHIHTSNPLTVDTGKDQPRRKGEYAMAGSGRRLSGSWVCVVGAVMVMWWMWPRGPAILQQLSER